MKQKLLTEITDEHIRKCAKIAEITEIVTVDKFGGIDNGCIDISGICRKKHRTLRIYYSGSNTRVLHEGFEVIEYCFDIYSYLQSVGYNVRPNIKKDTKKSILTWIKKAFTNLKK